MPNKKHQLIRAFVVQGHVDFDGVPHVGEYTLKNIHRPELCVGRHCVIHKPSAHKMSELPLIWNSPETQMERLCEHDVTHPDPDDLAYWLSVRQPWKAFHECCPENCCGQETGN
jgi:hypothetical protein